MDYVLSKDIKSYYETTKTTRTSEHETLEVIVVFVVPVLASPSRTNDLSFRPGGELRDSS
jgi:hypothetical protein